MSTRARAVVIAVILLVLLGTAAAQPLLGWNTPTDGAPFSSSATLEIVVNSADETDDGTCNATHCSLVEALRDAANNAGPDTVVFAIPTSDPSYDALTGVWTLQTDNGYLVPDDTTIDGSVSTGPGSSKPGIEIDATTEAQYKSGLRLGAGATLRGLVVNGFGYGIWIDQADVTVEGCYIGTDPAGHMGKPNTYDGILVARGATGAVIQDNLISGNNLGGIRMWGDPTQGNVIQRNLIGCDVDGTAALPNGSYGVKVHGGAHDNAIGPGNVIAFNDTYGVLVSEYLTRANTITQNSIHSNGFWGITLTAGGNDELPRPRVYQTGSRTEIVGSACANCVIEVFSDAWNQGEFLEGTVTANASGEWSFTKPSGLRGLHVTATATDSDGNTSEFSEPIRLPPPTTPTATRPPSTPTATRPPATLTATPTEPAETLAIYLPVIAKEWR
jgi:hypothetical protein